METSESTLDLSYSWYTPIPLVVNNMRLAAGDPEYYFWFIVPRYPKEIREQAYELLTERERTAFNASLVRCLKQNPNILSDSQ